MLPGYRNKSYGERAWDRSVQACRAHSHDDGVVGAVDRSCDSSRRRFNGGDPLRAYILLRHHDEVSVSQAM